MSELGKRGPTIGFAVRSFGTIDIRTVSPSRRGALVNWLVVTARLMIYDHFSDDTIEHLWRGCRGSHEDNEVIQVEIKDFRP